MRAIGKVLSQTATGGNKVWTKDAIREGTTSSMIFPFILDIPKLQDSMKQTELKSRDCRGNR